MYSIGQVSEMFHIPVSTLRYYDKERLFPNIERKSGIRKFGESEIEALHIIESLKSSGLEIKEIRQFMHWCTLGKETYAQRKELFETRRMAVEAEIERLGRTLDMLKYKCWYYAKAMEDGNEDAILEMLPDHLPPEIQKLYDNGHR